MTSLRRVSSSLSLPLFLVFRSLLPPRASNRHSHTIPTNPIPETTAMSSYDKDPQRADAESHTQKDPVGASHGTVDNLNDQYFRNPPNNLDLANPAEQDRASDLVGSQNTEAIADPPSKEELARVQELADRLNK